MIQIIGISLIFGATYIVIRCICKYFKNKKLRKTPNVYPIDIQSYDALIMLQYHELLSQNKKRQQCVEKFVESLNLAPNTIEAMEYCVRFVDDFDKFCASYAPNSSDDNLKNNTLMTQYKIFLKKNSRRMLYADRFVLSQKLIPNTDKAIHYCLDHVDKLDKFCNEEYKKEHCLKPTSPRTLKSVPTVSQTKQPTKSIKSPNLSTTTKVIPSAKKNTGSSTITSQKIQLEWVDYDLTFTKQSDFYFQILLPKKGTVIFPHRRIKVLRRGFCEQNFESYLRKSMPKDVEVIGDSSLVLVDNGRPYEPDIAIIYKKLRIDIEIDEPYSGYSRQPTHFIGCGDDIRDANITNAGWVVIRFAEIQVHKEKRACLSTILMIMHKIYPEIKEIVPVKPLSKIKKWKKSEYDEMAREMSREKYLGTTHFGDDGLGSKQYIFRQTEQEKKAASHLRKLKISIAPDKNTLYFERDKRIQLLPTEHEYILDRKTRLRSVSTVVSYFFREFDTLYWTGIKAQQNGISQTHQKELWDCKSLKSKEVGTFLHKQIENYFDKKKTTLEYHYQYNGTLHKCEENIDISKEFRYFKAFIKDINPLRWEWPIFDSDVCIAGSIDLICKRGTEYFIYDWKRSNKINKNTTNQKYYGINGLENVPDTRYYKYCIQQNLYKYILEKNYGLKIGGMYLVVLHPDFDNYEIIEVPDMQKVIDTIISFIRMYNLI